MLGEMQSVGTDRGSKNGIARDKEQQTAAPATGGEQARQLSPSRIVVVAQDDGAAARQGLHRRQRIGQPFGVRHKDKRR